MLGKEELKVANVLRINEGVIVRMMSGRKIKVGKKNKFKIASMTILKFFYLLFIISITCSISGVFNK